MQNSNIICNFFFVGISKEFEKESAHKALCVCKELFGVMECVEECVGVGVGVGFGCSCGCECDTYIYVALNSFTYLYEYMYI